MTGIEALVGPAIAKAAGTGAARVAGWGVKSLVAGKRRRKIRALVHSKARAPQIEALEGLSEIDLSLLTTFCESLELEKIATSLCSAHLIEGSGRAADKFFTTIKEELRASLILWMGEPFNELIVDAVYDSILECVVQQVSPLLGRGALPSTVEAQLVATAGSLSAASTRNAALLKRIEDLREIKEFESELKTLAAGIHGTMRLPHAGTTRQVPYDHLFVEPRVLVSVDEVLDEPPSRIPIEKLLGVTVRTILLGDPGGGKSTLSRKLTFDIAADRQESLLGRVPFYVELRDYATSVRGRSKQTLIEYLEGLCRAPYNLEAPEGAIEYLLLNNRAVVILDGLDELLDVSLRRDVVQAVEGFALLFPTCPMLVTSRRVGYFEAALNDSLFTRATLGEFSSRQVESYVTKWFTLDESVEESRQVQLAASFMVDSQFVADLRVNPLMLSLMCGIYASENYIPRNRPDVYEKCALLLFERWDKQRGIVPDLSFDAHVQSALRALALHVFEIESSRPEELEESTKPLTEGIGRQDLIGFFTKYLRDKRFDSDEDAESAAVEFLDFCKGRAWVLTDIGAETYGFTHRTFLEYFAASQLARLHTSADRLYGRLRDDIRAGKSDVVAQLAVQILGRSAEDGADDFLDLVTKDSQGQTDQDGNGLSFAARALSFVVPRPQVLKDICTQAVRFYLQQTTPGDRDAFDAIESLFACSTENRSRVEAALRESLTSEFAADIVPERLLSLAFMQEGLLSRRIRWTEWAEANVQIYKEVLAANRGRFYWVALLEYESGVISLNELFKLHGVSSLYDFRIDGHDDSPPFVYRFIRMTGDGGYRGLVGMVSRSRMDAISNDLLRELPKQTTPWLRWRVDYDVASLALEKSGRESKKWVSVRMLLALPLLELRTRARARTPFGSLSALVAARFDNAEEVTLRSDLNAVFAGHPDALSLVLRWVEGDVALMSGIRPPKKKGRKAA
ncbi:NACHT domain-containing protein [Pseudarthrobacter sp. 1C304]|uniref:NACHT domain-containing protein n=1 Tax=Pseudarthrobacter sp. 1C304 TaxID=3457438 RepID=UPI003FD59418